MLDFEIFLVFLPLTERALANWCFCLVIGTGVGLVTFLLALYNGLSEISQGTGIQSTSEGRNIH